MIREGVTVANEEFYRHAAGKGGGLYRRVRGLRAARARPVPSDQPADARPRIDGKHKLYLGAALAYAISPIDLISERRFGPLGYLDDLVVIVAALNVLFKETDRAIIQEHWSGKADLLATVEKVLAQADQLIGKGRLDKILEAIGIRKPQTA